MSTSTPTDSERDPTRSLQLLALGWLVLAVPGLFWLSSIGVGGQRNVALAIGVGFLMILTERFPVEIELRRESHSFSFSKVPLVIGILLLSPLLVLALKLAASTIVLGGTYRQRGMKLVINLLAHTYEVLVVAAVMIALGTTYVSEPSRWLIAALAVTAADMVCTFVILTAISVVEGRWEADMFRGAGVGLAASTIDVALAILVVTLAELHSSAVWIALGIGGLVIALSRGYASLQARNRSMEQLDQFSRAVGGAVLDGSVIAQLLEETGRILHSDNAWLIVADAQDTRRVTAVDGVVVRQSAEPIDTWMLAQATDHARLETSSGPAAAELAAAGIDELLFCVASKSEHRSVVLAVADRLGAIRDFDAGDAELLQTLALHAGLSLLNLDLVNQLRDEITATEYQATHDSLTELPNRVLFRRTLDEALQQGRHAAVLLIDLDRFKDINDTLGHQNGDRLLIEIGRRLRTLLGSDHTVARLGGDEFAAMILDEPRHATVVDAAYEVARALEHPVTISDVEVDVGASVGVAFTSDVAHDADSLLRQADVAMYTAKADRSTVEEYSPDRDNYSPQRLSLVGRLRSAIENQDLVLHYQPQIELSTGRVIGVEALARWPQPGREPIPPDEFIHIAEHTGLIRPLTQLVLELSITQGARWQAQGRDLRVSLNLSPHNLIEPGIVGTIADALSAAGLSPERLMVELTETTVMANPARTLGVIEEIRGLGVGLAIDDFGTGHSSLSYLTTLPATEIKIDKSFVLAMATETSATSVVRSIIDLGRNLSLDVIAEGVETESAARSLTAMGCRLAQGYRYSRPLDVRAFERWHATYDAELDAEVAGDFKGELGTHFRPAPERVA